jgi:hypothetical protein
VLKTVPLVETTWEDWKKQHPHTLVLSIETGYRRSYEVDPYGIRAEKVLGVAVEGGQKAYPFEELGRVREFPLRDQVGGKSVLVYFDKKVNKAWLTDEAGGYINSFPTYFNAWHSFYPDSEVFQAE